MVRGIIIDGNPSAVKNLTSALKGQSWLSIVGEAYDGATGLRLLEDMKPDLLFIEIVMPDMNGLEIIRKARSCGLMKKFIIVSAYPEFAYAKEAILYDASGYCLKPVALDDLNACLEKVRLQLPAESGISAPITENRLARIMLEYISRHFCEDISVLDLAKLCSVNVNYAGQLFKRETGETVASYLTRLRMSKAAELLTETSDSISTIAEEVGFENYFYFARVFKRAMGQTPSHYRAAKNVIDHPN